MTRPLIAVLTDFGAADVYAGVLKGVIAALAPRAPVVDLTHGIPPGDVAAAALALWQAAPHMPDGTVFLAVVDPGVGSGRRAVAVEAPRFACVGPDNGIFTYLLAGEPGAAAVEIRLAPAGESPDSAPAAGRPASVSSTGRRVELPAAGRAGPSATFHGRDLFAPAAARLWSGMPLSRLGPPAPGLIQLPLPCLEMRGERVLYGEVLAADRFGNAVTSIGALRQGRGFVDLEPWLPGRPRARLSGTAFRAILPGGTEAPLVRTYSDVQPGLPLAYIGSDGLLEIGVNRGRAVDLLPLSRGAAVILQPA